VRVLFNVSVVDPLEMRKGLVGKRGESCIPKWNRRCDHIFNDTIERSMLFRVQVVDIRNDPVGTWLLVEQELAMRCVLWFVPGDIHFTG
jgi:hypothetical protein